MLCILGVLYYYLYLQVMGPPGIPGSKGDKGDIGSPGREGKIGLTGPSGAVGTPVSFINDENHHYSIPSVYHLFVCCNHILYKSCSRFVLIFTLVLNRVRKVNRVCRVSLV